MGLSNCLTRIAWNPLSTNIRNIYGTCRTWNRELVGFGINGCANYKDDAHFPFPAVRFRENTIEICALREKEKSDWKTLSCEEKKALYRASFCQTFSEFQHPTGQWKFILGCGLIATSFAFWSIMFHHFYVFEPLPASTTEPHQKAQLRRMLELRTNPIDGISSKWDYENDRWKTVPIISLSWSTGPCKSPCFTQVENPGEARVLTLDPKRVKRP